MSRINLKEQTGSKGWKTRMSYEIVSQDKETNKTTIKAYLSVYTPYESWNQNKNEAYYTIYGGGKTWYPYHFYGGWNNDIGSRTFTVEHNPDGTKSITLTGYFNTSNETTYTPASVSFSQSIKLPSIPRKATITSCPNIVDTESLKVTFSNKAGSAAHMEMAISTDGSRADLCSYRTVSGSSYTFKFGQGELEAIYNYTKNKDKGKANCKVILYTEIGSYSDKSIVSRTISVANAEPNMTIAASDVNPKTTVLTNDAAGTIVKGYSTIEAAMTPTFYKNASLKSSLISNNGKSIGGYSSTFEKSADGTVDFTLVDSRNFTNKKTKTFSVVDYIPVTCTIIPKLELATDNTATLVVDFKGEYFNNKFGANGVNNTLNLSVFIDNNETIIPAAISGNSYTATYTQTGLDYKTAITIYGKAADKLTSVQTSSTTIRTLPVFNWTKEKFNFNVPVEFQESFKGAVKLVKDAEIDFNTYRTEGIYSFTGTSNLINCPFGTNGWLIVIPYLDSTGVKQIWVRYGSDLTTNQYANRIVYSDGSTSPWNKCINTVEAEDDTLDGWHYRSWSNGDYECWIQLHTTAPLNVAWGNIFATPSEQCFKSVPYPVEFLETPQVIATLHSGRDSWLHTEANHTRTHTGFYGVSCAKKYTSNDSFYLNIYVRGKVR